MNDSPDKHPGRQLEFLRQLLLTSATIGGDVVEIGKDTWAIHGVIPVDGEVLMAEFDTYGEASHVLDQLRGGTGSTRDLFPQPPAAIEEPRAPVGGLGWWRRP